MKNINQNHFGTGDNVTGDKKQSLETQGRSLPVWAQWVAWVVGILSLLIAIYLSI